MKPELSFQEAHELNQQVAINAFGWKLRKKGDPCYDNMAGPGFYLGNLFVSSIWRLPHWSTDIVEAWSLVSHFEREGWVWSTHSMKEGRRGSFVELGFPLSPVMSMHEHVEAEGPTGMPEAICRAIVLANTKILAHKNECHS